MKNSAKPPAPPGHLSREAKRLWRTFMEGWVFSDDALVILEGSLEAFDRMRQAQAIIDKEGIVILDRFKQQKQHPATIVERDSRAALLRGLKSLGLDLEPVRDQAGRPPGRGW